MGEPAFLYVIGSRLGPHKVGLSANPRRRLSQLQVGSPARLILKRCQPAASTNAEAVEGYAHWLLRESFVRGEWFSVTEQAAWVALVAAEQAIDAGLTCPEPRRIGGGRKPALDDKTLVRFKAGTLDRIDAVAGKFRRAEWIREQIEAALPKAERAKRKPSPPQE